MIKLSFLSKKLAQSFLNFLLFNMVRRKTKSIRESICNVAFVQYFPFLGWQVYAETNCGVYVQNIQRNGANVFCFLYSFSPQPPRQCLGPPCHLSIVLPMLACLIIWSERFRGIQKEDDRGPLSIQFTLIQCISSVTHQQLIVTPQHSFSPISTSDCTSLIILVTFRDSYNLRIGFYLPLWNND